MQDEIDRLAEVIARERYNKGWGMLNEAQQLDITEFASNYSGVIPE